MRNLRPRKTYAVFLAIVVFAAILSYVYSLPPSSDVIPSTLSISPIYEVTATSGSAAAIQSAINNVISHGGGTVYVPAGDWRVDQQPVDGYGNGGAISIDLENLPAGAWLNITGSYTNTTVIQQNGLALYNVPSCILRSYACNDNNLTGPICTFSVIGSPEESGNLNNYKSETRHIRISGFTILGDVIQEPTLGENPQMYDNDGIVLSWVDGFLIDHCAIDSNTGSSISSSASKGVISNCDFSALYKVIHGGIWNYGVQVSGNFQYYISSEYGTPTWIQNISQVWGLYDWQGITLKYTTIPANVNTGTMPWPVYTTSDISFTAGPVYIESSTFNWIRHCATSSGFGYFVFRFNTCYNGTVGFPFVDEHGGGEWSLSAVAYASRGEEVYNNTLYGTAPGTGMYGIDDTGGSGLIYNNTIKNVAIGIYLQNRNYNNGDPVDPEYINDCWIWNNVFNNVGTALSVTSNDGITTGVNYFCDSCGGTVTPTAPAPPPSGYTPYVYPHPLTQ